MLNLFQYLRPDVGVDFLVLGPELGLELNDLADAPAVDFLSG